MHDTPSLGILSHSSMSSNVPAADNLDFSDGYDLASASNTSNHINPNEPPNKIIRASSVNHFVFDTSSQQFIDSMKYTDLTLSVEPPGYTSPIEIPCHKFMLAKKVNQNH